MKEKHLTFLLIFFVLSIITIFITCYYHIMNQQTITLTIDESNPSKINRVEMSQKEYIAISEGFIPLEKVVDKDNTYLVCTKDVGLEYFVTVDILPHLKGSFIS